MNVHVELQHARKVNSNTADDPVSTVSHSLIVEVKVTQRESIYPYIAPRHLGMSKPSNRGPLTNPSAKTLEYFSIGCRHPASVRIERTRLDVLSVITVDGNKHSAHEVLQALNYGTNPLFSQLAESRGFRYTTDTHCIWDEALVYDFAKSLFGAGTHDLGIQHFGAANSGGVLQGTLKDRLRSEDIRILVESINLFNVLGLRRRFPHSFLVTSVSRFVTYWKRGVRDETSGSVTESPDYDNFLHESKEFWKDLFRNYTLERSLTGLENLYPDFVFNEDRWEEPMDIFLMKRFSGLLSGKNLEDIVRLSPREDIISYLRMDSESGNHNTWRSELLSVVGIADMETRRRDELLGPLDELKASNLFAGPFGVGLTKYPSEHLTFVDGVLRLLNIKNLFAIYPYQRLGIARYVH